MMVAEVGDRPSYLLMGVYSLGFLGGVWFASVTFGGVRKLWRYQGTDVLEVLPHSFLNTSREDKLRIARAAPSALLVALMMPILLGLMVLRGWLLVLWGIDLNVDAIAGVGIALIVPGALLVLLTRHLHWPQMLIPPAFRGGRPHFPWSNR